MCNETIVATDAKRIYIHHWDDFNTQLSPLKPMDWFMNKIPLIDAPKPFTDGCGEMVKKFKGDAKSQFPKPGAVRNEDGFYEDEDMLDLDPQYAEAKRKWEEYEKSRTTWERNGKPKDSEPPRPSKALDEVRIFKFLPLFKRIKI